MPITHAKSNTIADWNGTVTLANSTGGTTTAAASDLVRPSDWNSGHVVSLSASEVAGLFTVANGLTMSTDANDITFGLGTEAIYEPFPLHNTNSTVSAPGIGTWYLDGPYVFRKPYASGQFCVADANAAGFVAGAVFSAAVTGSVTKYQTLWQGWAMYKQNSANTAQLTLANAAYVSYLATESWGVTSTASDQVAVTHALTVSIPSQFDASGGITYGTVSSSGSVSVQSTTMVSSSANSFVSVPNNYVSGSRMDIIPWASSITPDNYWIGHMWSSTSSTTGTGYGAGTLFSTQSRLGLLENNLVAFKRPGFSTTNSTSNFLPFHGFLATTTSAATANIGTGDVRGTTGRAYFVYMQSTF